MVDLFWPLTLAALAWLSARSSLVHAIYKTDSDVQMLTLLIQNTIWWTLLTVALHVFFTWGYFLLMFNMARFVFLACINWEYACDNHAKIKELLDFD